MKKNQKKEEIDLSQLPKSNMIVSSLLLDFKNPDTKFKIFETFYKNLQNDPLFFFITREHIIDYAKDQKIYEVADAKKANPKDAPVQPPKEITPEQLSKACLQLIVEKSIECRKEKKIIFDKISEATAKKEESEKYWKKKLEEQQLAAEAAAKAAAEQEINPIVEVKKPKKKKKVTKAKAGKEEAEAIPPKPEEIEIPVYDEYTNEMYVILYNYPLSNEEYTCLINEKNENGEQVHLNLIKIINDMDPYEVKEEEVVLDKKGKPVQKEAKLDKDTAEMQRFFKSTLVLPPRLKPKPEKKEEEGSVKPTEQAEVPPQAPKKEEPKKDKKKGKNVPAQEESKVNTEEDLYEETPLILKDVYDNFIKLKENSDNSSPFREAVFDSFDFNLKVTNEETGEDTISELFRNFLIQLGKMHAQMVFYESWKKQKNIINLQEKDEQKEYFSIKKCVEINTGIDYVKDSGQRNLLTFCSYLLKEKRNEINNKAPFKINNFEEIFQKNFDYYTYNFSQCNTNLMKSDSINNISINNVNELSTAPIENKSIKESSREITQSKNANNNKDKKTKPTNNAATPLEDNSNVYHGDEKTFSEKGDLKQNKQDKVVDGGEEIFQQQKSHPMIFLEQEDQAFETSIKNCNEISSPINLLINYHDYIYKTSLEEKINEKLIYRVSKNLNVFLCHPSIIECLKAFYSQGNKKFLNQMGKNNEIYPLLKKKNISKFVYDKYHEISFLENMVMEKVPEQKCDFGDRIYEEIFDKDIFKQELNRILNMDYEVYAKTDPETNKTLLAFFYRCPKGRVYRKRTNYRYLSTPDFSHFCESFSPHFKLSEKINDEMNKTKSKLSKDGKKKDEKKNDKKKGKDDSKLMEGLNKEEMKFIIIDEPNKNIEDLRQNLTSTSYNNIVNKQKEKEAPLYQADDLRVGETKESLKYMFPSDNGVFIKKIIQNGIYPRTISYTRKDDIIFGIKKSPENFNELWMNFMEDTKLTITYKNDYNPNFKNTEDPVESHDGSFITLSLSDGLMVQIEPNGDIIQKHFTNPEKDCKNLVEQNSPQPKIEELNSSYKEKYRVITGKGSVMKVFDDQTKILYANGNTATIKDGKITNINNKGKSIVKPIPSSDSEKSGETTEVDGILYSEYFDKESQTDSIVRQDNVITIKYSDNSRYVIHEDNTKIFTSPTIKEVTSYVVENENFASVEIIYDEVKKRTNSTIAAGSTEALMGAENPMDRAFNGRISKILLPNSIIIYIYKEKKGSEEFEQYQFNTVTLIYRPDGTVVRVSQMGDVVLVTANERKVLNNLGAKKDFENMKDTDFLFEINGKPSERKAGVYTIDLKVGKIWTRDDETNIFEQHSNGDAKCKIEGTTITEMNEKTIDEITVHSPKYEGRSYINPETRFCMPPKNFYPPRLFVVDNSKQFSDEYVKEYLCEEQIEIFKRNMSKINKNNIKYEQKLNNLNGHITHSWIIKQKSDKEKYKELQILERSIKLPNKYVPLTQTLEAELYPKQTTYIIRKIKETCGITKEIRDEIEAADNFYSTTVRLKPKPMNDPIDPAILKLNRDLQRRFIKERMVEEEKNNNVEDNKEEKNVEKKEAKKEIKANKEIDANKIEKIKEGINVIMEEKEESKEGTERKDRYLKF